MLCPRLVLPCATVKKKLLCYFKEVALLPPCICACAAISQAKPIATAVPLSTLAYLRALGAVGSALLGGLSKAHATSAIKRHGASAKQRFMRSTTSKIATGIGLASIANLASQRQQQKAFLQATSGRSAKEIDALFDKITDNAIAAAEANFLSKAQATADPGWHRAQPPFKPK